MTYLLPTTPKGIQQGILFVAKTFRGEEEKKKDGKDYLNHFSSLEKSLNFLWKFASKFISLKSIVESFCQKGNKSVKWPKKSQGLWNICIPWATTIL